MWAPTASGLPTVSGPVRSKIHRKGWEAHVYLYKNKVPHLPHTESAGPLMRKK